MPDRHTSVSIWLSKLQLVLLMKTRRPSCVKPPTALPAARPPAWQPPSHSGAKATAYLTNQVQSWCACLSKLLLLHDMIGTSCQGRCTLKSSHSMFTCCRHSHKCGALQAAQHHCLGSHLQHGLSAAPRPSTLLGVAAADGPHLPRRGSSQQLLWTRQHSTQACVYP